MSRFAQYAWSAIGFTLLVLVLNFAQPKVTQAAHPHDVTVDNTAVNPVPITPDPHLTHLGRLPSEHVLLRLSFNGLFNYDTSQGNIYPFTVPSGHALIVTDIEAVFTGLNGPQPFNLMYVQLPANLLFDTPFMTMILPDAAGNAVLHEHFTAGFVIPAGLSPRLDSGSATPTPNTLIVRGYLVPTT